MRNAKITPTVLLLASALLCGTLSSCKNAKSDSTESASPSQPSVSDEQSYEDVYLSQIEYYEGLIKKLEDKLLSEKENSYIINTEYQLQIDELQRNIAALTEKLEEISDNSQISPPQATTTTVPERNPSLESSPIYNNEGNIPTTEVLASQSNFKYQASNGVITIVAYLGSDKTVVIPSTIDGLTVTSIGEEAFKNSQAERIVIPDTVSYIDWFAFYSCKNLCEVTIPSSVTSIAHGVFDLCPENIIIKCKKNSYAEAYAKSWGFIAITE